MRWFIHSNDISGGTIGQNSSLASFTDWDGRLPVPTFNLPVTIARYIAWNIFKTEIIVRSILNFVYHSSIDTVLKTHVCEFTWGQDCKTKKSGGYVHAFLFCFGEGEADWNKKEIWTTKKPYKSYVWVWNMNSGGLYRSNPGAHLSSEEHHGRRSLSVDTL